MVLTMCLVLVPIFERAQVSRRNVGEYRILCYDDNLRLGLEDLAHEDKLEDQKDQCCEQGLLRVLN